MRLETEADKAGEREVARILATAWRCEIHEAPDLSPFDWYATRADLVVAVLELKRRKVEWRRYDTIYVAVRKWWALHVVASRFGVDAFFVAQFTDSLRYAPLDAIEGAMKRKGRFDRGLAADVEPVIELPIRNMKEVR